MLDESFGQLQGLLSDLQDRWETIITEEDSKLQLIQEILTRVLGWKVKNFQAERQHDSGFSDYIISDANAPAFIVEAKRIGKLVVHTAEPNKYKAFRISGPALKECLLAIEQARGYASDEGIGFYVVTDGACWIVGKTNVEGKKWRDTEALVFPSLEAVASNFAAFYDLLHLNQVRKRIYVREFDQVHQGRVVFDREQFCF